MKILSIDVGIKNLALCILETKPDVSIVFWDVINLFEEQNKICQFNIIDKKKNYKQCTKDAKFHKNGCFFCKTHAAKSEYKLPTSDLKNYKKMKLCDLIKLANDYDIYPLGNVSPTKTTLIKVIESFIEKSVFENISAMKCNEISLINIGIAIKEKLEKLDTFIFSNIDVILIENQISPIANRMNAIQGMLTQYFIMKNMNNIIYVSAANKLKFFIGNKKTTYSERKKIGVEETKKLLITMDKDNIEKDKIIDMFNKHKKKDDLADCFLQGIWYKGQHAIASLVP
jgi:hypothetical protein